MNNTQIGHLTCALAYTEKAIRKTNVFDDVLSPLQKAASVLGLIGIVEKIGSARLQNSEFHTDMRIVLQHLQNIKRAEDESKKLTL